MLRKIRSWLVLFLMLISPFLLVVFSPGRLGFWAGLLVVTYFVLVAVIDIEHRIIMHPVSIAGGLIGLCIGAWQHGWTSTLIGGIAGLGFMFIVYLIGGVFAKWLAKRKKIETEEEGFGFGDVALSGVLGLLLGWPGIIAGLTLAVLLGGVGSLVAIISSLLAKKYQAFLTIPYGPFLIIGAAILLFRPGA